MSGRLRRADSESSYDAHLGMTKACGRMTKEGALSQ